MIREFCRAELRGVPSKKNFKTLGDAKRGDDDEDIFISNTFDFSFRRRSVGCGRTDERPTFPDKTSFLQVLNRDFMMAPEANCINCTAGNCPAPAGYETNPRWTKSSGLFQNCQNCNEDPYRWVSWYDDGGGCFDETNSCFWLRQVPINCTAGDPPQPWTCFRYAFLECQIGNCVDADGDGFPRAPLTGETCVRDRYDCNDSDRFINPDATENCNEPDGVD